MFGIGRRDCSVSTLRRDLQARAIDYCVAASACRVAPRRYISGIAASRIIKYCDAAKGGPHRNPQRRLSVGPAGVPTLGRPFPFRGYASPEETIRLNEQAKSRSIRMLHTQDIPTRVRGPAQGGTAGGLPTARRY